VPINKIVDYYMDLQYSITCIKAVAMDGNVRWFAKVKELPGCMTQADNWKELGEMIKDAMRCWIVTALEDGINIPEPEEK
jgi:antitoxin HicB